VNEPTVINGVVHFPVRWAKPGRTMSKRTPGCCPKCDKPVIRVQRYTDGSAFYVHREWVEVGPCMDGCTVAKAERSA